MGVEGVPLAVYPGVILNDSDEKFEQRVFSDVVPQLISGLTKSPMSLVDELERESTDVPSAECDIVFRGTLDEIIDEFERRHWGDGLPIVPPTPERVDHFLRFTDRDFDEVLGVLLPANRRATVWSVAVNGVMAGCRPEYMPILIALIEAAADPHFRIEDAGSTPGWETLISISGPLVPELNFNFEAGALRVGARANTSIGRFFRLYLNNVAGLRPYPDETDKGAIAGSFHVVLAENGDVVRELGWPTHGEDRGYGPDDTVVTLRSVFSVSAPIYSAGSSGLQHLDVIARLTADAIGPWAYQSYMHRQQHPLLVLCPAIARALAADGITKTDIRQFMYDNVTVDGAWVQRYAPMVSGRNFTWNKLVELKLAPEEYRDADRDGQRVRAFVTPEALDIVVAGNPGRNQSRAFISNHGQGIATSRLVKQRNGRVDRRSI